MMGFVKVGMETFSGTGPRAMAKQAVALSVIFWFMYLISAWNALGSLILSLDWLISTRYVLLGTLMISPLFVGAYQLVIRTTGAAE